MNKAVIINCWAFRNQSSKRNLGLIHYLAELPILIWVIGNSQQIKRINLLPIYQLRLLVQGGVGEGFYTEPT